MHPQDWSIQMISLMIRSKIESKHHRTVERSMMQLQALVEHVNASLPNVSIAILLIHISMKLACLLTFIH